MVDIVALIVRYVVEWWTRTTGLKKIRHLLIHIDILKPTMSTTRTRLHTAMNGNGRFYDGSRAAPSSVSLSQCASQSEAHSYFATVAHKS